ncbi:hypothetical protein GQ457_08G037060 [Hibiscus cannabinus]
MSSAAIQLHQALKNAFRDSPSLPTSMRQNIEPVHLQSDTIINPTLPIHLASMKSSCAALIAISQQKRPNCLQMYLKITLSGYPPHSQNSHAFRFILLCCPVHIELQYSCHWRRPFGLP